MFVNVKAVLAVLVFNLLLVIFVTPAFAGNYDRFYTGEFKKDHCKILIELRSDSTDNRWDQISFYHATDVEKANPIDTAFVAQNLYEDDGKMHGTSFLGKFVVTLKKTGDNYSGHVSFHTKVKEVCDGKKIDNQDFELSQE